MTAVDPQSTASARSGRRAVSVFFAVFLPLVAVYSLTAQWALPYHIDAMTNAISGWYIGNEGTVIASQHAALATEEQYANLGWFVDSPDGPVGQYPPGAAAVAGLAYLLAPSDEMTVRTMVGTNFDVGAATIPVPPMWPATLTAVLSTAAAAAVLALVFLEMSDRRTAMLGGLVFGLATGAWGVASAMSWTHGPAMLGLALGLLAAQKQRWLLGGLAFGFAILCRPHLAIVVALIGVVVAHRRRSWRPLVGLGLGSATGMTALLAYNAAVFDRLSISGGYGDLFEEQFAESGLGWFLGNVLRGLVDPAHGLFIWAPFLVLLLVGLVTVRRQIPDWAMAAALGGALYLLVQWRANAFAGGEGHTGYRYPLEAITVAAPALFLGYHRWVRGKATLERVLTLLVAAAFAGQLAAATNG